ncbi:carbonic anhydrase [Pedobacter sp. CG_S7]
MSTFEILLGFSLLGMIILYTRKNNKRSTDQVKEQDVISGSILSAEQQKALHPDKILSILKKGNQDFVDGVLTIRNNSERMRQASLGQYPLAVVLSCLDSRVPVEDVFHQGIGDIFVLRVAGNIVNEDILGSLEYACKVSGSKLILVLGHEYCGAIRSAVDNVKIGNITALLEKIRPAVIASMDFPGEKTAANPKYLHHVCTENVKLSVANIRSKSPILNEMEAQGAIKIVGAVYDMETGRVNFN